MGMSASQARYLCLTARKNNLEFEIQQTTQAKEQEPQKQDEKEENVGSTQSGAPEA